MFQFLFRFFIELTNGRVTSKLLRKFCQSRLSKPIIPLYLRIFQIERFEINCHTSTFKSLHDLFIRSLKEGSRPIAEGELVVSSPVDGVFEDFGSIYEDESIIVKGKKYSIKEMLGEETDLQKYVGGKYIVLYLSPRNYHRIHAPITGKVLKRWSLGEKSYPVNKWGMKYGREPLSKNFRLITELQNENICMAIVKVGAMFINTIEITDEAMYLRKGQEFSYFSFGSTVVLLLEHDKFEVNKELQISEEIRVGEKIGTIKR